MLLAFERRQAAAILEAYAPPRAESADEPKEGTFDDDAKTSGERKVRLLVPRPGEVEYIGPVLKMMAASTSKARLGIHLGLAIATFAPLWLTGRFRTMAGLPVEERTPIICRLVKHENFLVRELMLLLKIGVSLGLIGTPSVRARTRFTAPREAREKKLREVRALPVLPGSSERADAPKAAGVTATKEVA